MMNILTKFSSFSNYLKVFLSPIDVMRFRKLYRNKIKQNSLIQLHVRESNFPLYCRPNTTDAQVLWDTFYKKYHLPPQRLKDNAIIVDLGANIGCTMAHFAYLYPTSRIIGAEMDYENFSIALKNLKLLKKCTIIHYAVWYENKIVKYCGDKEWGYHVVDEYNDNINNVTKKVDSITIDSIIAKFDLKKIDYLKMDIEGSEKQILKNAEKWIDHVQSLQMEIHPTTSYKECSDLLSKYRFECFKSPMGLYAVKNVN